jgi:hypothetical protein
VLRSNKYECIVIGKLFNELYEHMKPMQTWLTETDKEKVTKVVNIFLSMILVLIDRTECPADEESLQENSYFKDPERAATLKTWLGYYADLWESLPEYLRDPVGPYDKKGNPTRLDGTLFRALLDRHYQHTLSESKKQMLKGRLWSVGQTIRKMHNYTWQGDKYVKCMTHALRACFKLIKYTNGELIQAIVNFENVSDVLYESRTTDAKTGKGTAKVIEQSLPWTDHMIKDVSIPILPLSWGNCVVTCVARMKKIEVDTNVPWPMSSNKQIEKYEEEMTRFNEAMGRLQEKFTMSSPPYKTYSSGAPDRAGDIIVNVEGDRKLIEALLHYSEKATADHVAALHSCSAGGKIQGDDKYTLGAMCWFILECKLTRNLENKPALKARSPLYVHNMYDEDLVDAEAIITWYDADDEHCLRFLPVGCTSISAEDIRGIKDLCGPLVEQLKEMSDEEEEESEDED